MPRWPQLAPTLALAVLGAACSTPGTGDVEDGSAGPARATVVPPTASRRNGSTPETPAMVPRAPRGTDPVREATPAEGPTDPVDAGATDGPPPYPLHGATFHFLAHVYDRPSLDAPTVGHLRRGARFRASERVGEEGCEGGWYEVAGGGFVCRGRGYILGREPQSFEPAPIPPSLEEPLPYPYAWVRTDGVPQYWELPTADQERALAEWLADRDRDPRDGGAHGDGGVAPDGDGADAGDGGDGKPPWLRFVMRRGFYVSLDGEVTAGDGRTFARTVRGTYVPADALVPVPDTVAPGVRLGPGRTLPLAIVHRDGPTRWRRVATSGALRADGRYERLASFSVADTVTVRGRRLVVSRDGTMVDARAVRTVRARPRPEDVPEGGRWVHVRLSEQTLVAYEGDRPVYATVVSTGRDGFETPTGLHRIQSKHVTATMDDLSSEDPYLIEDVPWVMYFEGSYALHGAFWHSRFGRPRSHGCVNLAPDDARWLFRWSSPSLPPAWHGVMARGGRQGTHVLIEP